jgi:inorganic triphosphatase YgiF
MDATSQLETEQKYDAGPDFELPDLSGLPGYTVTEPETFHMTAIYFDTDDHRLPVRPGTRRERHLPLSAGTDTVPDEMQTLVAEFTDGQPLRPIAQLDTVRTIRRLAGPDGQARAEVADDHVTGQRLDADGGPEAGDPLVWHEVEVELMSGPPDVLAVAGNRLRAAGAQPSASASKLGRVMGQG